MHIQCSVISRVVNYKAGEINLTGYISFPANATAGAPGVVIAHDWNGRDEFEDGRAEELANHGYIAFAYDIYGEKGTNEDHNVKLMTPFNKNRTLLLERVKLAFEQLVQNSIDRNLNPTKLAIIGYCFGGRAVLDAARANLPGLRAAVTFHGFLDAPREQRHGVSSPIKASILVLHAYNDKSITSTDVTKFENEMISRKADWQLNVYGNVDHAFTVPGQSRYRKQIADRAWNDMLTFLASSLA